MIAEGGIFLIIIATQLNYISCLDTSNIARSVTFGSNCHIGNFVSIGPNTVVDVNSEIGSNVQIGRKVNIKQNVTIEDNAILHNEVTIEDYSKVKNGAVLSHGVSIGQYSIVESKAFLDFLVNVFDFVRIGHKVKIGKDSIVDSYTNIRENSKLHNSVYVGRYVFIDKGKTIGKRVIIHEYTHVDDNIVDENIVIKAPTTRELFHQFYREASHNEKSIAQSPRFEPELRRLVDLAWTDANHCTSGNRCIYMHLKTIFVLYLLRYYPNSYTQLGNNVNTLPLPLMTVYDTPHFLAKHHNFLSSELETEIIKLFTIELDQRRQKRVESDNNFNTFIDIESGKRSIIVKESNSINIINAINISGSNIIIGSSPSVVFNQHRPIQRTNHRYQATSEPSNDNEIVQTPRSTMDNAVRLSNFHQPKIPNKSRSILKT